MTTKTPTSLKSEAEIRQTLEGKKSLADKTLETITEKFLPIDKGKPKHEIVAHLSDDQKNQLREIEENAIAGFTGMLDELESALGMLRMGHHFGWRVLYLIHSKKTIRKYEDILGIKIRDIFPAEGPSSYRSVGLNLANKASNFWKVVSGEEKIEDRRLVK